ncbi:MAG: hypothetical protein WC375_13470, partial [Methanomassiliicoccales archaeon]
MILKELVDLMDVAVVSMPSDYMFMRVCELGNQIMKWHPLKTGKQYLLAKGVKEHVSIDMNGKDGALKIDLASPITKWDCYFDMVTNYGTSEHVSNQYQVFDNIHRMTAVNGVMVHVVPIIGGWATHCNFHYKTTFFMDLAEMAGYRTVLHETRL